MASLHPMYTALGRPWKAETAAHGACPTPVQALDRHQGWSGRCTQPPVVSGPLGSGRRTASDPQHRAGRTLPDHRLPTHEGDPRGVTPVERVADGPGRRQGVMLRTPTV
jgi:hypothetical protein